MLKQEYILYVEEMKSSKGDKVFHSITNDKVVAWFRKRKWTMTKNGYRAKCPKCSKENINKSNSLVRK